MLKITQKNYYSLEANRAYFNVSSIKEYLKCPRKWKAMLDGTWVEPDKDVFFYGHYVDCALTEPKKFPAGTRLEAMLVYDNSEARQEIAPVFHSSSDHTQFVGLKEKRTGSPWPMYGGGPVAAKAWNALPATDKRNTIIATAPRPLSSRAFDLASPSPISRSSTPIMARATPKMTADQKKILREYAATEGTEPHEKKWWNF